MNMDVSRVSNTLRRGFLLNLIACFVFVDLVLLDDDAADLLSLISIKFLTNKVFI